MTDTPQDAWMREYERLKLRYREACEAESVMEDADTFDADIVRRRKEREAALDAHVRGLVEENERLRGILAAYVHACYEQGINLGPITGDAEAALATRKD